MRLLEKLLFVGGIAKAAYSKWLLQKLINSAVIVAGLTIVCAMMVSVLLAGAFYGAFLLLIANGYSSLAAYSITIGILFLFVIVLIWSLIGYINRLKRFFIHRSPVGDGMSVVQSFMDGFSSSKAE